jgi:hypothetical protein
MATIGSGSGIGGGGGVVPFLPLGFGLTLFFVPLVGDGLFAPFLPLTDFGGD